MSKNPPNRIFDLRKRADLTLEQLAEFANTSATQIQRLETSQRKLTANWIDRLKGPLKATPAEFFPDADGIGPQLSVRMIPVYKAVAAGAWRAVEDPGTPDFEPYEAPVLPTADNANAFGVRVLGDSMDLEFKEGSTLVCRSLMEWGGELESGQFVIVESKDGGSVEYTCKQYWVAPDGAPWLRPMSNNPEHQAFRADQADAGIEITITAVVVDIIKKAPGFG